MVVVSGVCVDTGQEDRTDWTAFEKGALTAF